MDASLDDRFAFVAELFEQHADSVFHVAWRIVWSRADAEDVTQTTFVRAFTRLGQLDDPTRVRPWLLQIAYRSALEVLRRRRDVPTDPAQMPEQLASDDVEQDVERRAVVAQIHAAIDELPDTVRLAFVLRDIEGLAMADVATTLGIGPSAAKMRVARAREHLRVQLEGRRHDL